MRATSGGLPFSSASRSARLLPSISFMLKKFACSSRNYLLAGTDKYKQLAAFDKDWDAALPYTVLLGTDGKVLYKANGKINPVELRKRIVDTLGRYMDPPKKK